MGRVPLPIRTYATIPRVAFSDQARAGGDGLAPCEEVKAEKPDNSKRAAALMTVKRRPEGVWQAHGGRNCSNTKKVGRQKHS